MYAVCVTCFSGGQTFVVDCQHSFIATRIGLLMMIDCVVYFC